ncbi:hypothetical protein [Falsibacillus albus]|uniref:Uncharacterized protein n=1 Tax=Falsibacillus albus TaxID=2478915 RepID=A0A3L7JUK0_9BACI|nr:hypothetical protein [Falsibacillus albus]RLQ94567.1 hypothetical protein D9X91_13585 [Falsibacillus albus]
MPRRAKILTFIVIILFIGLCFKAIPVLATGGGNLHQEIHWMVYGYDRVWYHDRTYLQPTKEYTPTQAVQKFGQGKRLYPTGEKVIGLPVYSSHKKQDGLTTLLILKKHNGNFIVYTLSGGP